jgi:hypothetical protein
MAARPISERERQLQAEAGTATQDGRNRTQSQNRALMELNRVRLDAERSWMAQNGMADRFNPGPQALPGMLPGELQALAFNQNRHAQRLADGGRDRFGLL